MRTRTRWLVAGLVFVVAGLIVWVRQNALSWARQVAPGQVQQPLDVLEQEKRYSRPFEPYVKSLEDRGEVVDIDLVNGPMPPESENAAGEIDAVWKDVLGTFGPKATWRPTAYWTAETPEEGAAAVADPAALHELQAFLGELRPFVDRLDRALERPHLRHPRIIDAATDEPSTEWTKPIWGITRVLGTAARYGERREDRLRAIRLAALLGARFDSAEEYHHLMAIGSSGLAIHEVHRLLEAGDSDPASIRVALGPLLAAESFPRMAGYLRHERAEVIWQCRKMRVRKLKLGQMPESHFIGASEALGAAIDWVPLGAAEWHRRFEDHLATTGVRTNMYVIGPRHMASFFTQHDAKTRLARIALAAVEHRAKHGDLPASLDELKPAFPDRIPLDPFTDAPFAYQRTDKEVRIASLGQPADSAKTMDLEALRERALVWVLPR